MTLEDKQADGFPDAKQTKTNQPAVTEEEKSIPPENIPAPVPTIPKITDPFKPEDPPPFLEKPAFIPPKPISHSPKISPSSIPNPNPSVTTTKQVESGYPNYGGFMYSVPGYSAFQPVSYPGVMQPSSLTLPQKEVQNPDFSYSIPNEGVTRIEEKPDAKLTDTNNSKDAAKLQTDFEEHFTTEVIPALNTNDVNNMQIGESQGNVPSLTQVSGAIVMPQIIKDIKKKPPERFSLKTSIPISKIDMKCVNTSPVNVIQNTIPKKPFNPAFHTPVTKENSVRVEIQSNVIVKSAIKDQEVPQVTPPPIIANNSISTLINAAEVINKTETVNNIESTSEVTNDIKEHTFATPLNTSSHRGIFNPINIETSKSTSLVKTQDTAISEPKNQIVFIQNNKNPTNPKMLLTIQQPNPQVLLQRANFDPKNLQAPSRISSQPKKCKEELIKENGSSSKVVSLKRLHQENCDENDFENLITENQIYGNKIVVKEKSQGTSQEQDLKNKIKSEKSNSLESKNVVLQPNFLYLSNVQFPANLMMIKNNTKVANDQNNRANLNENKPTEEQIIANPSDVSLKPNKTQITNKEIHILKSNNNVLQSLPNKKSKPDLIFQTTNQKVIMNPQIVYQVPMIVDTDSKLNQSFVGRDFSKVIGQNKKEFQKPFDQNKNDKLFIACPYQMDSKLQPKIVITNIRSKVPKIEEVSSLDLYEKRKRLRRMKYLSNRDIKCNQATDNQKPDSKKPQDTLRNIITPEKMKSEIYKEFAITKLKSGGEISDNDSDYGEDEIEEYKSIVKEFETQVKSLEIQKNAAKKAKFLANFQLASQEDYKERELERRERILRKDAVAAAYIAAGRIDCLVKDNFPERGVRHSVPVQQTVNNKTDESDAEQKTKQMFLSGLNLVQVSSKYKDEYEKIWKEVIKERARRELPTGNDQFSKQSKLRTENRLLDHNGQLRLLTEIKNHVNENNNLIKKKLDSNCEDGESIKVLAEKNFSELNRLSIMADRSVKHFSGQTTRKRDLNPGFDSENIQKAACYPDINIPNISKIVSLKSAQTSCVVSTMQATSMDEPCSSAAVVPQVKKTQDFSCQVNDTAWPGIESVVKIFKEYDNARKKEIADLHRRNTALRVDSAHITRAASRDSDRARALLAERRNLANEERNVRNSIHWLCTVVEMVRNYREKTD